jgi:hypothetical protein
MESLRLGIDRDDTSISTARYPPLLTAGKSLQPLNPAADKRPIRFGPNALDRRFFDVFLYFLMLWVGGATF